MLGQRAGSVAEFTVKAVVTGVLLGLLFGAANAYLGLRVGLTVSASIPAAVMTVAVLRALRLRATILEANLSQTIGSASTSLASGTIFTIPALFLWGLLLGDGDAELPYPEGRACAEVLRATTGDAASASRWIFGGMALGAAIKLGVSLMYLVPSSVGVELPILPRAELAIELAPALLGVGFILGYRSSAVLVAGSVVAALALIPLIAWIGAGATTPVFPERERLLSQMDAAAIWSRYVRYIGAGAVAVAGLVTVLRALPTMVTALAAVARGLGRHPGRSASAAISTDRDLPPIFVVASVCCVIAAVALVPGVLAGGMSFVPRLVCAAGVAIFGILFVTVAARIVGIVGVTSQPTSGITLVTLLGVASIFAAVGWTEPAARAAVLTVGTLVAVAASKSGDISQDLKTGWLVGATPARQQLGQLIGASCACWVVAGTVVLLGQAYTFGSRDVPAPQAMLMKTIIEGVLAGELPWGLVLTGGGVALGAILCGVSALAFAIGVYLPLSSMAAIYAGGCARAMVDRRRRSRPEGSGDPGVLAASGLVAGEGLAGVLVAALVAGGFIGRSVPPRLDGTPGELVALALVLAVGAFLVAAGSPARRAPAGV